VPMENNELLVIGASGIQSLKLVVWFNLSYTLT
jgi:hypothetical protein